MTNTLGDFDQVIALATVFNDDKFVSTMKEARRLLKQVEQANRDLDEREKLLKQRENEAKVVLNSQETFSQQHSEAMVKLDGDLKVYQGQKDALAAEKKAFKALSDADNERLRLWEADLSQAQNAVDRVLQTEDKKKAALERVAAKEARLTARLAELGVREVA